MRRKFLLKVMILSLLFVAMGGGHLFAQELLVNCDYNSSVEGYGTTKFSNYAGAYAYATANATTATIVIEKTNTLSGNTFDNNHKNYTQLAVVIKDGATMGNALSKWDMTYPVTVEPGGTLTCAHPKTASVSYIHIKNTLTVGAVGSDKKAYVDFLSDTYQDCDISIRYNGKINVYNSVFRVQDLDAQGTLTIADSDVTVDGAFASATFFATTLTNTNMTVNGNQISGGISDFAGGDSNQLGKVTLKNSTITIKEGTTKVAAKVTAEEGSKINVNDLTINANVTANGSEINVNDLTINNGKKVYLEEGSVLDVETLNIVGTGSVVPDETSTIENNGQIIVAMIGQNVYTSLQDAITAASAMEGDVTVDIYERVTLKESLSGDYSLIKFVGKDTDAEIYLDVQGYITATGKNVAFEDLTLSKSEGGFIGNAGFMNVAFGVYDVTEVTYTNCVFDNGACASSGKVTYTECTFMKSWDKYGLWAYGNVDVTVNGCTFADYRGIKMYAEGAAKTVDLTVKNTNFSAVDNKPAIVLTYGESVTLENNTYSSTGVFELDLDGAPNGTPINYTDNSDEKLTCKNDNGACGVLCDGKIYTTVAQAAEVATSGSTVTLLHNSTETVVLPMGVTLNKNGYDADGVTVAEPIAKIGEVGYTSLQAAIDAVQNGETIELLSDVTENVTLTEATDLYYTINGSDKTMNGKITVNSLSDTNDNRRITIKNIKFVDNTDDNVDFISSVNTNHYPRLTISGCDFTGSGNDGDVAIRLKSSHSVVIENCTGIGLHSFLQNTSGWNLTINKVTVTESKGGLALGTVQGVTVKDSNIDVNGYGIRLDADTYNNNAVIESCTVNAFIPVVVRKVNTASSITFNGTNTMTQTNTDGLWCAIGKGEYENNGEMPEAPATGQVTVTLNGTGLSMDGVYGAFFPVKIGETGYATLAAAAEAAQAGETITLFADVTEDVTLPAGITFNGNGKAVGNITAAGTITFNGHTKATSFNVEYTNTTVNIVEGACLEITGAGRMVIGHGCTFNITGTIAEAKTANVAELTPSLIMPGASFTGAGVTFNVTNAYIKTISSYCSSKNSNANSTFDFNIKNSIWEQYGSLVFSEPTNGMDPTVNFELKNSVLNSTSHLVFAVTKGDVVFDNSNVNVGTSRQIENRSTMTVKNGSVVKGAVATSSNAKNPGTLIVDNATYAVTGEFSGSDLGTGTLIIKKGANVSVGSIKAGANVVVDAEGMAAGDNINFTADLSQFTGTLSVINNDNLEAKIVGGKIVLVEKPVAKIGETEYATLQAALQAAAQTEELTTIQLLAGTHTFGNVKFPATLKNVTIVGADNKATIIKDSKLYSADGNAVTYKGITFDGIVFDNSSILFTGARNGEVVYEDWTIKNCDFSDLQSTDGIAAIHFNLAADETIKNFTFEKNTITNVTSPSNSASGLRLNYVTGNVVIKDNETNNVAFNAVQIINSVVDNFTFEGNILRSNGSSLANLYNVTGENIVITKNQFLVANEDQKGVSNIAYADVSGNYWGGGAPINLPVGVVFSSYYTTVESDGTLGGLVELPQGNNFTGYTGVDAIWGEVWGNAKVSFVVKVLDANGNVMGTTSLNNIGGIINGNVNVTWSLKLDAASNTDEYWTMAWTTAPTIDNMPAKVELWVDGVKVSGGNVVLNGPDEIAKIYAAVTNASGKILGYYTDIQEAIKAAAAVDGARATTAGTVEFLADVTVDKWIMFAENLTIDDGSLITLNINGVTIDGNGKALTVKSIESAGNGGYLFYDAQNLTVKDLTINIADGLVGGIGLQQGTISNVNFNGGNYGVFPGANGVTIENCTFTGTKSSAVYYEEGRQGIVVKNNSFNTADGAYAITMRSNEQFTGNIITKGKVNIANSSSATVTGNNFGQERFKVYNAATATISDNIINNLVFNETDVPTESTFTDNTLSAEAQAAIDALPALAGEGTEANPYLINDVDDLVWLQVKVDESAQDGSTQFAGKYFKLTNDIDLSGINWNPIGKMSGDHGSFKGVFDGGDHIISNLYVAQAGNGIGLFARTTGNAVIKNLKLNNVTVKSTDNSNYVGGLVGNAYASTKIENVHVIGNVCISGRGYIGGIAGHGYVVMDNVSVVATGDGEGNDKGLITSTFWCAGGVLGYAGEGATNIMNAHVANVVVTSAAGGLGAIVGMAEDNDGTQPISGSNLSAENVEIKTYTGAYGDAYANYALGYLYGGNPTSILTGELSVEKVTIETSNGVPPEVNDAVAKIGNSIYFNLQAVLNAGGNVTVLRDIALAEGVTVAADKTVTLDLNGKTITGTPAEAKAFAVITNKGDLTITDGTETEGKIVCDHKLAGSTGYAVNTITNSGTLTIAAGTIQNTSTASNQIGYAIDNNSTTGNTILVIEGGKVTASCSSYYDGIRQFCNSETNENSVTIKGGEVSSLWLQNPSDGSGTQNTKDVKGSFAINGGTLNNLYLEPSTQFVGAIIGGHVGNISRFQTAEGRDLEGFISGGTFSSDVSEFCAEGFKVEQNTDGTYGVVPFETKEYVIDANGEIKTLADAIAKAKEDGTDIVTYTIYGAATLETGYSHGIVDFGGREGYITIQGGSDNTRSTDSFTITGGGVPDIKGVTFKDLTFYDEGTYLPTANEFMYQNFIDCTFENVKFEDGIRLSGNCTIKDCEVNANTTDEYAIWLDEGEFEITGTEVEAGNDAYGMIKSDNADKITITNNTFTYLGKVNKEALNTKGATIIADGNTFIDCAKGIVPADKVNYTADGTTQITDAIIADDNTIIIYVAKIGDVKYQSLADAATAAQDGETIQLLWAEGKAPIAMKASLYGNKNVTITGTATVDWSKGWLFVGRGGEGDATLIFDGAILTSNEGSLANGSYGIHVSAKEGDEVNKNYGKVIFKNSDVQLSYLANRNNVEVDGGKLYVHYGFWVGGRPSTETPDALDGTATMDIKNGAVVVVNNHNGMGLGYESKGIMNIDATSSFETTQSFLITANGTMNVNGGNVKVAGTLTNAGTVYVTGAANLDANVTGNGWFYMNGVTLDADTELLGAKVGFINGVNTIVGSTIDNGFFSVGIGQNASATTAAAFAGANGITLGNVTVNVSENAIIGGNGETYSGWVGSAYSADKTQHTYTLNVENSLAAFGYMHVSKDGIMNINGRSADDNKYTQDNSNVNFYAGDLIVNGNVTIYNADAWVKFTKMSVDHADGVLNITGDTNYESSIHNGGNTRESLIFYNAGKVNIDATSNVEIDNKTTLVEGAELNIASANVIAKGDVTGNGAINFTALTAKFTAQEDLTIVDKVNNPNYAIAYLDGTYQYAEYVAQIGDEKYLTLQEAIDAAQNNETITLLVDVSQADGVIINSKNIVVDLNEKTFTVTEGASTSNRNFKITGTSVVTIKNGTMVAAGDYSSGAYGTVRTEETAKVTLTGLKLYNYRGNGLNIKAYGGTTVNISNTEIYSQYGGGIEAAGGTITLAETVKVEQKGMYTAPYNSMAISVNSGGTVTVNGGTYSTECITAEEADNQGTSHGPWVVGVLNSGGKLVINGGTFSNDNYGDNSLATYARGAVLADTGAEIEINGGTFNALKAIIDMTNNLGDSNNNPSALLSGGTFSADPRISGMYASELIVVAVNYEVKKLPNGYYTVIQTSGTQTREFATLGWHWFSTYINYENGEEGLDELQEQLDGNAATIKGQTAFTNYQTFDGNNFWTSGNNSLTSISASNMYMIKTINDNVSVSLEGGFVDYEQYEISIHKNWNWIGYPLNTEVNVTDALAGFTPENGDQIKGKIQGQTSTYISMLGGWAPDFTMMPGEGYMYYSQADDNKPLVYRTGDRGNHNVKTSVENNHWIVDEYKYSSNMTVTAMLSIDGEIVKDNYEVAAFANGECRGSARPIYIEALDAYMLFMTIQGEDVENLTFKYYDVNYGTEYELNNTMVYSNDAIVGTIEEPYMFNLGILNIDETSVDQISIYPNPTTTGKEINLQAMCDKVEVFNALGMKVAEYTNVDSIDAIETAGIYVIRVTIDGNARNCRLVVK